MIWLDSIGLSLLSPGLSSLYWQFRCYWKYMILFLNSFKCWPVAEIRLEKKYFEAERLIWLDSISLSLLSPKLSVYYWQLRCYWKYVIFLLINFKSCSLVLIWLENMFLKQRDRSDLIPFHIVYYHLNCQYITDNWGVIENMW